MNSRLRVTSGGYPCEKDYIKERPTTLPPDLQQSAVAKGAACAEQPLMISVPRAVAGRAKLKARLLNLLRASLFDDAKGVVNVVQEKEIRKLANELRKEDQQQYWPGSEPSIADPGR